MGWDKGRYYTRSRKVNGRVVPEYVGAGEIAALVAQMDALDAPLDRVCQEAELLARAALVVEGFRQHKRGEWRKRRGNCRPAE